CKEGAGRDGEARGGKGMRGLAGRGTAAAAAAILTTANASAQGRLSAVEKLYAEVAALPAPERARRIEDGARREGKLVLVHTLRGELGAGHVDLFRKRYPFLALDVAGGSGPP